MNPVAVKYGAPLLPQVNLIPKDINDKRTMRVVQTFAALALVAALGLVVVATVVAMLAENVARGQLNSALQDETAAVESRDALKPVYDAYLVQEQGELTLTQIGWAEMAYTDLFTTFLAQDNDQVSIKDVTFSLPSPDGPAGAGAADMWNGGVGTINATVFTRDRQSALDFSDRVEQVPGVARVVVRTQGFQDESGAVYWKATLQAQVMPSYLTMRLIPASGLISQEMLEQAVEAAQADPSAAPTAPATPPSATPSATATSEG